MTVFGTVESTLTRCLGVVNKPKVKPGKTYLTHKPVWLLADEAGDHRRWS